MGKFTYAHNNFTSGQLSQRLAGRIDIKEYENGCETLHNMIPFKQGGVIKRPGSTLFKHPAADAAANFDNDKIFMIPYIYNKTTCYTFVVDVDNSAVRAYTNGGTDLTLSGLVSGSWTIASTLDVSGFDWVQIGYFLILTHNSGLMPPKVITPSFDTSGGLSGLVLSDFTAFAHEVPYLDVNTTPTTLTISSASVGFATLTASTAIFTANSVGSYYMIRHGITWGITYVSTYTNTTTVQVVNVIPFAATTATDVWRESAWSKTQGYPRAVSSYEGRLVFGGTLRKPDTLWFSMTANIKFFLNQRLGVGPAGFPEYIEGYIGDIQAEDPLDIPIAGDQANVIVWIIPGRSLHVGTTGEEYLISFNGDVVKGTEPPSVRSITAYGSSPIKPVKMNDMSIFITRDGKRLRSIVYTEENGSFSSSDLNILADDIYEHNATVASIFSRIQIKQIVAHPSRNIVWALTTENELVGVTISEDGKVFAWHTHTLAGASDGAGTNTKIMAITVLPNSYGAWDDLYMVVKRWINGSAKYYVEKIQGDFVGNETNNATVDFPIMLDSALSQTVPGSTTLANLTNYIAEELSVVADGEYLGEFTVNGSGEITLPDTYSNHVYTGYKFTPTLKTMDLEAGGDFGVAMGLMKRIDRAFIKFHKTRKAKIGTTSTNQIDVGFADSTVLFTGDKKLVINNSPGETGNIIITQSDPYPLTVLAIASRGVTYD